MQQQQQQRPRQSGTARCARCSLRQGWTMHVIAELRRHNRLKQFRRRNLETASNDRTFLTPAGGVLGTMKTREWKTQDWKTRGHHVYG